MTVIEIQYCRNLPGLARVSVFIDGKERYLKVSGAVDAVGTALEWSEREDGIIVRPEMPFAKA